MAAPRTSLIGHDLEHLALGALGAGPHVEAVRDHGTTSAALGYRLGARVDLPDPPAAAASREAPDHRGDLAVTGLSYGQYRHLVGGRDIVAGRPEHGAAASLHTRLAADGIELPFSWCSRRTALNV
jgi:hypothetical protein